MSPREEALYLLAGRIRPGPPFFQAAAKALAIRTGCRWAGIGELNDAGDTVRILAFWDRDHLAESFDFPLEGSPCVEIYGSRPEDPHKFFGREVATRFPESPMLADLGARSYRGEVFLSAEDRPVGHVFVISEQEEVDSPDVRDFFRLVTQRVGAEYDRWKLSDEVAERTAEVEERDRLLRELETSKAEIEASNAELERFTRAVSHDLKSPLLTITGYLGMLEQDVTQGEVQQVPSSIEKIRAAAAQMRQLIDELLELSQIGRVVSAAEKVDLGDLARQAVVMVGGRIAERNVQVEIASDLPVVQGDRSRLLQVLQNLIENAAKFMDGQREPRIEIGGCCSDSHRGCYVRDNGIGIEARNQKRIFGLFERLDPTQEGTGTGLAVVRRILEVHGGRVWVESAGAGHGSTFTFEIPQAGPPRKLQASDRR